jgi:hypothetical protein
VTITKRICNRCSEAEMVRIKDGIATAVAWKCPRCFKGYCKHKRTWGKGKVCEACYIIELDEQAIKRSAKKSAA